MRRRRRPCVIALAGPNGAGKSTVGPDLLRGALQVTEFVNADIIAQGLSAFNADSVAIAAGRIMLARLRELGARRADFAFETTLSGRTQAKWIQRLLEAGYEFHLMFLWLPSAELAVERVRSRMELGGHSVPEETVRRRYSAGLHNFFHVYRPLASSWRFYDNSRETGPRMLASMRSGGRVSVRLSKTWERIREEWER